MAMYTLKQIPSEAQIRKYLKAILFGKHIFCPSCHSFSVVVNDGRYRCRSCRKKFSLLSHTWLSEMKLSSQKFWLLLWCWTKQVPVKQTQEISLLSEEAVRHWFDLFRSHLPEEQTLLEHIIQLDEAYFGGMTGIALVMGKQKGTRKLAYRIFSHNAPSKQDAVEFVKTFVAKDSALYTDGSMIYHNIHKHVPVTHTVDIHKKFEFTHTSEIEGTFGNLRTFIRRMYHHSTTEKLPEYICEFYFRFCRPELFDSPHQYLQNTLHLGPSD